VRELKKIIFKVNAQTTAEGELLHFDTFTEMLRIPAARNNKAKKFSDFLFAPVSAIII